MMDFAPTLHRLRDMLRAPACLILALIASPALARHSPEIGTITAITVRYETQSVKEMGSSSSRGSYHYVERVVAASEEGVEREYVNPESGEDRPLADWHLPVRVLERPDGTLVITNRAEMEARRDHFLQEAEIPVEACGSWYFTWNAFQVECDPDSVLSTIAYLDIQPQILAEGALYQHDKALRPGTLSIVAVEGEGTTYRTQMPVSPDAIRLESAEGDVVVGEIMRDPITLEEAIAARRGDIVEGTVTVTLTADPDGVVHTRTVELEVDYTDSEGVVEHTTARRTTTRRRE